MFAEHAEPEARRNRPATPSLPTAARSAPRAARTTGLLNLQTLVGNHAVSRLVVGRQEVPDASADSAAPTTPTAKDEGVPGSRPPLDLKDHGPGVALLRRLLIEAGYPVAETGPFGNGTLRAVKAFQNDRAKLHPATGGVGPKTWGALDARPSPALAGVTMSIAEVAALAKNAGIPQSQLVTCVAIAYAESGGLHVWAYNDRNKDGTVDRGLWQMNSGFPSQDSDEIFSPELNAYAMAKLSNHGKDWHFWAVFNHGQYNGWAPLVSRTLGIPWNPPTAP